jgi:nucleoside-diphosphate-sugar epimerase
LGLVRDHFIKRGLALVPWDEEPDFCFIGAGLEDETHPPLAQLELQKMQVRETTVLLLSTNEFYLNARDDAREYSAIGYSPEDDAALRAKCLYAMAAEHVFLEREARTVVIRPFNVYGPDITWGLIHETINACRKGEDLRNPRNDWSSTSFIHQDDFLKAIDLLMAKDANGIFNVGTTEDTTYVNLLRNIWKFVNGADTEPDIEATNCAFEYDLPSIRELQTATGWKSKISLRSGLFKMVQE